MSGIFFFPGSPHRPVVTVSGHCTTYGFETFHWKLRLIIQLFRLAAKVLP